MSISEKLLYIAKQKGYSIPQLEGLSGISHVTLNRPKNDPSVHFSDKNIELLCVALGVRLELVIDFKTTANE